MVALCAIVKDTGVVSLELTKSRTAKMLSDKDSANFTTVNRQALDLGYGAVYSAINRASI